MVEAMVMAMAMAMENMEMAIIKMKNYHGWIGLKKGFDFLGLNDIDD